MAESKSAALPLGYAPSRRVSECAGARWRRRADHSGAASPDQRSHYPLVVDFGGHFRLIWGQGDSAQVATAAGRRQMTYRAPVSDIAFALKHAAGFKQALDDG